MHSLEAMLVMASVAVERDEIGNAELVRTLLFLGGASAGFIPEVAEDPELIKLCETWGKRFDSLMHGDSKPAKPPLRRVVLDDQVEPVKARKRDNRLARAFRAILENPGKTTAELAAIAGVTEPMLGYYHTQLRSLYSVIYEKAGGQVIPMLPELTK